MIQDRNLKEAILIRRQLTDEQWARIADLVPGKKSDSGRTGKDTRLFLDAVLWIARTGSPWRDLPDAFGPWYTAYTRFWRWSRRGVWLSLFNALVEDPDFEYLIIDSTIVRAHQHSAGAKGGLKIRPSDEVAAA